MIVPLKDRVLLEKLEVEKKTASGIILAEASKEKPSMANVVAVGPGSEVDGKLVPVGVEVGQLVIFKQYAGTDIKYENKEYLIVDSKDILAVIK
ncbi:MAG: co-chaperone GroES [Erysipelothrix sp.]|nr:co-chaperone GroES [Erysipelothrix sp.]